MITVAQSKLRHKSGILAHTLGPLLWALSTGIGWLRRRTIKAARVGELEMSPAEANPEPSEHCQIIDFAFDIYLETYIKDADKCNIG